jgi:chloramphenicol O-acetyltransferase
LLSKNSYSTFGFWFAWRKVWPIGWSFSTSFLFLQTLGVSNLFVFIMAAHNHCHLLKDLPKALDTKFKKITDTLIALDEKYDQNLALQKYFERNSLHELQKLTKKNNNRIKRKIKKLICLTLNELETKLSLHIQCVKVLTLNLQVIRHIQT